MESLSFCLSRGVFFIRSVMAEEEKIETILFEKLHFLKFYCLIMLYLSDVYVSFRIPFPL